MLPLQWPGHLVDFYDIGGVRKKRKWIFKTCELPRPINPNWTNEVSLGLRLCHIKSSLRMLQTSHNYLMDSGLRQSWMENFHTHTHTPSKRQLPNLQGNRFWYLSLTALPVDYISAWKKIEHTLHRSFWMFFFGFSSAGFWGKDTTKHLHLNSRRNVSSPLRPGKRHPALASVLSCTEECAVSRHQLCRALAPKLLVVLFIRISIFHSCAAPLHPCGSKWPYVTGFTMDARSGATTQNKASSASCLWYAMLKWHFTQGVPLQWYKYIFFLD